MSTKKTTAKKSGNLTDKKSSAKKSVVNQKSNSGSNTEPALRELFIDELKDIYWAEKHLTKALPKMKKGASSEALSDAIGEHLEVTKVHVQRLEEVFSLLGEKAAAKKCEGMEGLTKEGESVIEETEDGSATRDAGIIISAQKVEHYEISAYGSLRQLALTLGEDEVADILEQTLNEEKEADQLLTSIAENDINYEAAEEDGE